MSSNDLEQEYDDRILDVISANKLILGTLDKVRLKMPTWTTADSADTLAILKTVLGIAD